MFGLVKQSELEDLRSSFQKDYDSLASSILDDDKVRNFSRNANLLLYKSNGILQTIIDSPAKDATREGFTLTVDNDDDGAISKAILKRFYQLNLVNNRFKMIKYSRIYREGSGIFFVIEGGKNLEETMDLSTEIPLFFPKIKKANVFEDPTEFTIEVKNPNDPRLETYGVIDLNIGMETVHNSRFVFLINNFDMDRNEGTSVVDAVRNGVLAQEAALSGTTRILERVGAVLFKSNSVDLSENKASVIKRMLTRIKSNLKQNGAMGLRPEDTAEILGFAFSGLKDSYDFVLDNLSALSGIPRSILIGGLKGGIITGEGNKGELINYYRDVENFQENYLKFIDTKIIDLIMSETDTEVGKLLKKKKRDFEISYNALWSMTEQEEAETNKINSQRDKLDFDSGKYSGNELRFLDPRTQTLPKTTKE